MAIEEYVVSLNLIINIIVGYEEEETISLGYVKSKTLSTAESCTGGKIAAY
jgi:hypothetical protein